MLHIDISLCHYDVIISIFSFTCVTPKQENVSGSYPILVKFDFLEEEIISSTTFEFVVDELRNLAYCFIINCIHASQGVHHHSFATVFGIRKYIVMISLH